ncbi:hypothetical protein HZS_6892 [Henneguya salminicola]|nr:hypothetical protein HZS_6892 [Henneguya salminicola]
MLCQINVRKFGVRVCKSTATNILTGFSRLGITQNESCLSIYNLVSYSFFRLRNARMNTVILAVNDVIFHKTIKSKKIHRRAI